MTDYVRLTLDAGVLAPLSKGKLIRFFAKEMHFPPYWRENWDSFEECMASSLEDESKVVELAHINWTDDDFCKVSPYREIIAKLELEFENMAVRNIASVECARPKSRNNSEC